MDRAVAGDCTLVERKQVVGRFEIDLAQEDSLCVNTPLLPDLFEAWE